MSTETEAPIETAPAPAAPPTVEAPAQETDWKAEARKWETRAKDNLATAKANEDAAKRLSEIEAANQTEAEKAVARAEAAEKRAADLELRALRAEVAGAKGVPADLLAGGTKEDLEASADALIAFRGQAPKPSAAPFIEGANKVAPEQDIDAAIAAAEKNRNFPLAITLKQQKAAQAKG